MKILIYSNKLKDQDFSTTKDIIKYLNERNVEVVVSETMYQDLQQFNVESFNSEIAETINILLVLGGDGTFLGAAHLYYQFHIPCIGINLGRVGYLTESNVVEWKNTIDLILEKKYNIKEASLLDIQIVSNEGFKKVVGFNEISIHRSNDFKMLKIDIKVKEQFMDTFYADGMLIATCMGSSAYNLSAGGPLILEGANCFVITPICSQSNIMPPVVVNNEDLIEVSATSKNNTKFNIIVDGKYHIEVANGTKVLVSKSTQTLPIININNKNKKINHISKMFSGYVN